MEVRGQFAGKVAARVDIDFFIETIQMTKQVGRHFQRHGNFTCCLDQKPSDVAVRSIVFNRGTGSVYST
ncbi:hypothetical protein BH591_15605 [Pseudomonas aeruginosa]|nr:hypothetical protein AAY82_19330 [Pseudomonas aeruginosa]KRV31447.1 hypothetical protein AN462_29070 [Pseudomonas aeruginosa]KZE31594.1 hypothetical protein AVT06_13295 [Pseudomonas aeruginosa]OKR25629.1 hypothetical protein BH591_15605 [Pseudomonas aeruginosa]OKR30386.1 hypothetical protein BH593_21325 [Pseudomonas aeruginosa]